MNKTLELLLQLEGLVLLKKGLHLAGPRIQVMGLEGLGEKIQELRRQVPGKVLSLHDKLARQYADPLTALVNGVCQGCHQKISHGLHCQTASPQRLLQCEHCGRLLYVQSQAPDYVS
jgi:predicted  nucleic acid-binding Zn-ribbon protein